jgi:hypothetical protein
MKYLKIKVLLITALSFVLTNSLHAQDKDIPKVLYTAGGIPDSLKEDANSVVRYAMEDITVDGPGDITIKRRKIITVLNEKANDEATVVLQYSKKYNSIGSFEMRIYNAEGNVIKKYHKTDMYERSAVSNSTILSDERLLVVGHSIASYPTTIEIIYDTRFKSATDIGDWYIQDDEQSVQNSYCHLTINNNAGFKYQNKYITAKPVKTTDGNNDIYSWHVANLKAIKIERGAKSWRILPRVYFNASKFIFYSTEGDFSSWQSFGKWIKSLNADVCTLSPQRVAEIQKMTADIKTDKEKVKFLYEYMQQNMRYVSIQLGIGGMKPFAATFVDDKKYGDCKALSNYMYALLQAVNIPANYAIINAGANAEPAEPGFPRNAFNHVILCVPLKGDTTWLECTSNTQQFGKLGSFTENRRALLITGDGGVLVNTPKSVAEDNQLNGEVHIKLDAEGGAKAQVKLVTTGEYRDDYLGVAYLKADDQKEAVIKLLKIKQPRALSFNPVSDKNGVKEVALDIDYDRFCDVMAGNKQFYRPRVFDIWGVTLPAIEKRKTDFYFKQPMIENCVTTIELPDGFEIESLPVNQSFKFTYGSFDVKYVYDAAKNQVVSTSNFNLTNHVIPSAKYTELQQYMENIAKAQNKKLVIRKKA